MTFETILPPSATVAERSLEAAAGDRPALPASILRLLECKENPTDDALLALVWEYGLEELMPFIADLRELISEGLAWQRIRGTPASIEQAFGWVGEGAATVENEEPDGVHWHEFQIDPGYTPNGPYDTDRLKRLAAISAPVGTKLARLFHGYDVRRLVLSDSEYGTFLSDYSGVRDADGLCLSFGRTQYASAAAPAPVVAMSLNRHHVERLGYDDIAMLDFMRIEDVSILNYAAFQGRMLRRWSRSTYTASVEISSMHARDYRVASFFTYYGSQPWGAALWGTQTWETSVIVQSSHSRSTV